MRKSRTKYNFRHFKLRNRVAPYIIASVVNLQMLPATYNIKKHIHNDIELDELLEAFYERY